MRGAGRVGVCWCFVVAGGLCCCFAVSLGSIGNQVSYLFFGLTFHTDFGFGSVVASANHCRGKTLKPSSGARKEEEGQTDNGVRLW